MENKVSVGIIGVTGNMGGQIAKGLLKAGYQVSGYARENEKLEVSKSEGVRIVSSETELAKNSEIIILALPHKVVEEVAKKIVSEVNGKIVISISNPLNESYSGLITGWETSAGEELQKILTEAKVVKAFNTVFAGVINNPVIKGITIDHMIAGDNESALKTVSELITSLGHHPIVIGGLTEARTLEHMAFINISLNAKGMYKWNSAYALLN